MDFMVRAISTQLFLARRLSPALLETLVDAGAQTIEVFAARHHFDYTDAGAVRELGGWFRSHDVQATMHMPLYPDAAWSRHTAPTLDLIAAAKTARIEAMDEVKRALEAAETVPFGACVLHLGMKDVSWDGRSLDDSMTAIEHLKAFAGPLGVHLLLENLANDVATPEHLVEIVRTGHFESVRFCLDVGHANLMAGVPETSHAAAKSAVELAFEDLGERVAAVHLHDNHGLRDEHLWPGEGDIDWKLVTAKMAALKAGTMGVIEVGNTQGEAGDVKRHCETVWETIA
jgi:sugar phosphate isomerase/epimerase